MKAKSFSGGYRFKGFGCQPENKLLPIDVPPRVIIPLFQGFGIPLEPLVKVGDRVSAGRFDAIVVSSMVVIYRCKRFRKIGLHYFVHSILQIGQIVKGSHIPK